MTSLLQRIELRFDSQIALRLHVILLADSWRDSIVLPSGKRVSADTRQVTLYDDQKLPWSPTMYLPRVW